MGFFDFVKDTWSTVSHGVSNAATSVYNSAIKPAIAWTGGAAETVYSGAIKPAIAWTGGAAATVYGGAESVVNKVVDKWDRVTDKGIDAFGGIADFMSSPVFMIGGLIVGGIVLTKILDNKK